MLTLSRAASSSLHRIYHHPRTMRTLTPADLNPAVLNVQYAVRGELAIKADELTEKLRSVEHQLPFKKVINSNIGNPQQKGLDQPPITFPRQVCLLIFMLASACCIHRPYLRFGAHPRMRGICASSNCNAVRGTCALTSPSVETVLACWPSVVRTSSSVHAHAHGYEPHLT